MPAAAIGERVGGRGALQARARCRRSLDVRGPCSKKESDDWLTRVAGLDEYEAEGIAKALS